MGTGAPRRLTAALPWLLVVMGLVLLARPIATDWWYAWQAERDISEIEAVYDGMTDPERLENLDQANAWNANLRGEDPGRALWDYAEQLTYHSTPKSMMAYVEIPKIATKLPIYHGTSPQVLAAGAGHCDWSSLPVGGAGTHCVLTAHSGMDRTRMFDDIRRLDVGDEFVLWTLGEPRAYRVAGSQVIEPDATEKLAAEPGRDLCSLVTCTPIGVNSHRLVVTAERCDYDPAMGEVGGVEPYVNDRTLPFLAGTAAVAAAGIALALLRRRKNRKTP